MRLQPQLPYISNTEKAVCFQIKTAKGTEGFKDFYVGSGALN